MFYPAEPDALNALIADVRKRARPDGERRAEGRHRAARRPRLFRLGRRDRIRPVDAPRRAAAPHRHRWPGASRRISQASRSTLRRNGARRSAKRRSRPSLMPNSPRLAAFSSTRGRSPASIRSKCIWSCCRRCCRRRSKSSPFWSATPIRRLSLGPCAGSGADRRRSSRSPPTCRIFSTKEAPNRSIPTPHGASRRSTPLRSTGAGLAASWPSRVRSRSPPSATCGERPASGDIGGRRRRRLAGCRLRRLRVRIRGLGAACRGRSRAAAFGLHDRPRPGDAERGQGAGARARPTNRPRFRPGARPSSP